MVLFILIVLVGLLVWIGVNLKSSTSPDSGGWEYELVNISRIEIWLIKNSLNEVGRSGWELVMLWSPPGANGEKEALYAVFKRRIPIGHSVQERSAR